MKFPVYQNPGVMTRGVCSGQRDQIHHIFLKKIHVAASGCGGHLILAKTLGHLEGGHNPHPTLEGYIKPI